MSETVEERKVVTCCTCKPRSNEFGSDRKFSDKRFSCRILVPSVLMALIFFSVGGLKKYCINKRNKKIALL